MVVSFAFYAHGHRQHRLVQTQAEHGARVGEKEV